MAIIGIRERLQMFHHTCNPNPDDPSLHLAKNTSEREAEPRKNSKDTVRRLAQRLIAAPAHARMRV